LVVWRKAAGQTEVAQRSPRRRGVKRGVYALVFALLVMAVAVAPVSAAAVTTNLAPAGVYDILVDVKPALHKSVDKVVPATLQILVATGRLSQAEAAEAHQIFVKGEAPANRPKIAEMLSKSGAERTAYAEQQLQEMGVLTAGDVQLFADLRNTPAEQVRDKAKQALESGAYSQAAQSILETAVLLSAIDPNQDYETCDAGSTNMRAQGWLGNALKWVGGLVDAVIDGAIEGLFWGTLVGRPGAGAAIGGIVGGIKYVMDTTGNGFVPGPNGEGCTGWPHRFPAF